MANTQVMRNSTPSSILKGRSTLIGRRESIVLKTTRQNKPSAPIDLNSASSSLNSNANKIENVSSSIIIHSVPSQSKFSGFNGLDSIALSHTDIAGQDQNMPSPTNISSTHAQDKRPRSTSPVARYPKRRLTLAGRGESAVPNSVNTCVWRSPPETFKAVYGCAVLHTRRIEQIVTLFAVAMEK